MLPVLSITSSNLASTISILLILIASIIVILAPRIYQYAVQWMPYYLENIRTMLSGLKIKKDMTNLTLDEVLETAGYSYDYEQDIFYSNLYAWQREMGYCRLYDEAAAPLSMIIDCEPIYFEYGKKRWLIEFWKGQYGMTTGCEIGIYATDGPKLNIAGVFNGTFYQCVSDQDLLQMSCVLEKGDRVLFSRKDRHWWLTGFKLGEFSEPSELTMSLFITLKNRRMRNAFIQGLMNAGYKQNEIIQSKNTVGIKFDEPRTIQPFTRTERTDWIIQRKNELLCDKYQEITREYDNSLDKIKAIQKEAPRMLGKVLAIGKTKQLFLQQYKKIKKHLIK